MSLIIHFLTKDGIVAISDKRTTVDKDKVNTHYMDATTKTMAFGALKLNARARHHISMRSVRAMMRPITAISFVRNPTLLRTKSFDEDWSSHGKNSSDSKNRISAKGLASCQLWWIPG